MISAIETKEKVRSAKARKLSDAFIESLPFAQTPQAIKEHGAGNSYTIGDSECPGLAIKVGLKNKVWQIAVRPLGGVTTKEKIGNYGSEFLGKDPRTGQEKLYRLNVVNARANAAVRIAALKQGKNISAEKKAEVRKAQSENRETLRWLIDKHKNEWIKKGPDGLPKKNSLKGINVAINHVKDWLDKPFREIDREMILERFNAISAEKNKQGKPKLVTANNVFRDLRTVFNNWIALNPDAGFRNPTEVLSRKRHKTSTRSNWIYTKDEGKPFIEWWKALQDDPNPVCRDYIAVTLLQGARETETAQLEWIHIHFDSKEISYLDTKNGGDYIFPMTPKVHEILKRIYESEDKHPKWVFPAARIRRKGMELNHISVPPADAVTRIVEKSGVVWTMHDLRRTFSNTLITLKVPADERRYMMKHTTQGVAAHYDDLRIMLADNLLKYENRLMSLVKPTDKKENDAVTEKASTARFVYRRVSR